MLAKYDQVLPGLAERIVALTEQQSAHRQALEHATVEGNIRAQSRGQVFAFIIVVVGMLIGGGLLLAGKSTAGFTALLTPLGLVATGFFVTRGQQARELARKRADLEEAGRR